MKRIAFGLLAALAAPALAQHMQGYTGMQARELKALSGDEVKQYQAGAGMGFALAAELNHYPGPMHVLELGDQLKLTPEQRDALHGLMDAHKADARSIGARLVEAERRLDRLFASKGVSAENLRLGVRTAEELRGEYRLAHLDTHRRTRDLLTAEQLALYDRLRGYGEAAHQRHQVQ
jgi:Spy/CpxP family protein refolding chaperone